MSRYQDIHLKLSRKIQDPVAAIATDGTTVTALQRQDYLNRASTFIQLFFRDKRDQAQDWIQGLLKVHALTWSGSGTSVNSDYAYWISVTHGTNNSGRFTYFPPEHKANLDSQLETDPAAAFTIIGGKIYGYQGGVPLTSGSGNLLYIQTDQQSASPPTDATPAIDAFWDDTLVEIAATFYYEDKLEMPNAEAQSKRFNAILSTINGNAKS